MDNSQKYPNPNPNITTLLILFPSFCQLLHSLIPQLLSSNNPCLLNSKSQPTLLSMPIGSQPIHHSSLIYIFLKNVFLYYETWDTSNQVIKVLTLSIWLITWLNSALSCFYFFVILTQGFKGKKRNEEGKGKAKEKPFFLGMKEKFHDFSSFGPF